MLARTGSAFYLGPLNDAPEHAHYLVQIYISLTENFELRLGQNNPWQSFSGAVVRSNAPHSLRAHGAIAAMLLLAPESTKGRLPIPAPDDPPIAAIPAERVESIRRALRSAEERKGAREIQARDMEELQTEILSLIGIDNIQKTAVDDRVTDAMERITRNAGHDWKVEALAREYRLSSRQFRHIFSAHLGISPRRFIQWARVEKASEAFLSGRPIGQAALAAGFADAAHLTRCFRRMTGTVPSAFGGGVKFITPRDE